MNKSPRIYSVFAFLGSAGAGHPPGVPDLQRCLYCCPQQPQVSSQADRGTAEAHPPLPVGGQPLDGVVCHPVCHLPDPLQLLALRKVDVSVAGTILSFVKLSHVKVQLLITFKMHE